MTVKTMTLDDYAQDWMQDPEEAAAYLNEALEEGDEALLLVALRRIAKNYDGGIRGLSKDLGMNRSSLNNALDEKGNPTIKTLLKVTDKLGYRFQLVPKQDNEPGAHA